MKSGFCFTMAYSMDKSFFQLFNSIDWESTHAPFWLFVHKWWEWFCLFFPPQEASVPARISPLPSSPEASIVGESVAEPPTRAKTQLNTQVYTVFTLPNAYPGWNVDNQHSNGQYLSTYQDLISQSGKVVGVDVLVCKLWPWWQVGGAAGGGCGCRGDSGGSGDRRSWCGQYQGRIRLGGDHRWRYHSRWLHRRQLWFMGL